MVTYGKCYYQKFMFVQCQNLDYLVFKNLTYYYFFYIMFFLFIPIVLGFNLSYSNGTENNTIRAVAADFGFIPYGHSFEGKVYAANGFDLC